MMEQQWRKIHFMFWAFLAISWLEVNGLSGNCDLFTGKWVLDESGSHPLYNASGCPFVVKEYDCPKNGRRDLQYLKYKWKPDGCDLPRFDGRDFLGRLKGKKIMFVGDSLSSNQWQSLKCMLHAASLGSKFSFYETDTLSTFRLEEEDVTIVKNHSPFLVDLVNEKRGKVLKLDSVAINSKAWEGIDVLVFNSYHWWLHEGRLQNWDFIEKGKEFIKDMDRMTAFKYAMGTWAKWVDSHVDPKKQSVFFQTVSPTHYVGAEWGQPGSNCKGQTGPVEGSKYRGVIPPGVEIVKEVVRGMKTKVSLLDITRLSQLRKDGHPSVFDGKGNDCSHWCLAGVPDSWNELMYALLLSQQHSKY